MGEAREHTSSPGWHWYLRRVAIGLAALAAVYAVVAAAGDIGGEGAVTFVRAGEAIAVAGGGALAGVLAAARWWDNPSRLLRVTVGSLAVSMALAAVTIGVALSPLPGTVSDVTFAAECVTALGALAAGFGCVPAFRDRQQRSAPQQSLS